jgi:hypothetical protein
MRPGAVIAGLAATVAAVAAVPAGADNGGSCDRTAAVTAGTVVAIDTTTGRPVEGAVQELRRGRTHPYAVTGGPAAVVFQGVRYRLAAGSQFLLGCYGESRAVGARFPRLVLGAGRATVTTAEGRTGAVSNAAAMVNPKTRIAMTFVVEAHSFSQLRVTKDPRATGLVAVTPYAGPRKGTCRYVKASAALDAEADTALYDGRRSP